MNTRSALIFSRGAAGPALSEPEQDWQDSAACASVDPELFYPEAGGSVAYAKRVCRSCPVTAECLEYALEIGDTWGVWGGKSVSQREALMGAPESQPAVRLCMRGLHAMAGENLTGSGSCRACKQAAERARRLRLKRGQARETLWEAA